MTETVTSASNKRRAWLAVAGWTLLVYTTIPLARTIQEGVQAHGGQELFLWATFASFGLTAGWTAMAIFRGRLMLRPMAIAVLCAVGLSFAALAWSLRENPEESIHCLEYGILGWLLLRAVQHQFHSLAAPFTAAMIGISLGIVDELIQWLIPGRYFDFRDLGINGVSVLLALAALVATTQARAQSRFRPDWGGLHVGLLAAACSLGLLLFCCANTAGLLGWYGRVIPALAAIDEVTAEYGHLHDNNAGLVFPSRLDRKELDRQDRERAAEVGQELARFRAETAYARFLRLHPPYRDPLLVESRVRLFRRDRHALLAAQSQDDPGLRRSHARIAVAENRIMAEFFPAVLHRSGYAWPEPIRARLVALAGPVGRYRSPVSDSLITIASRQTVLSGLAIMLALTLAAAAWARRLERLCTSAAVLPPRTGPGLLEAHRLPEEYRHQDGDHH